MPLRILICLLYYRPHCTGLTRHVQLLAEELAQRGHQVTILTSRYSETLPRSETAAGVRVVRLWSPIRISRGMVMPSYPLAFWRLVRSHDVVSLHSPMMEASLACRLAGWAGVPCVATHHGDLTLPPGLVNRVIGAAMGSLQHSMARRVRQLVAYSEDYGSHSTLLAPYRQRVQVIQPPVDIPLPRPERVAQLRAEWDAESGPRILFSGRFVREKRPDLLIRALDRLDDGVPGGRIIFAGEHEIRYENTWAQHRDLVDRYRDRLQFLGLIEDRQELADVYGASDVLVLPSDTECFGLAQVEAMLCGTPVVATDVPGGRVPVKTTGMGCLALPGDAQDLAASIAKVLGDRPRFVRPRHEIESLFSLERSIDAYERLFYRHSRAGAEK
ncbi:MAG: glycosyltransferase family 4 protein [Thermoanaerobaculia bacterium]|nr:glycosyltransferase family 4 protein [Thermoanaerobaculia bacterium]